MIFCIADVKIEEACDEEETDLLLQRFLIPQRHLPRNK